MGDFDFGQFQEIMNYLIDKLNDGDALTPQEQQVYDMLIGFSNQGLNLTNTADFNSLYTAFNGLADDATKQAFENQYGQGIVQNQDGTVSFSKPGSVMEAFQRRGQSINDGPAMAALVEGLKQYNQQLAQNKFAGMTNAYSAMTPIRQQNIDAASRAGNVASTAIGRRAAVAGGAIGGARGGSGGGEGSGEGVNVPIPPGPPTPSLLDRLAPDLVRLLGGAGLAGAGFLLKDWWNKKPGTTEGKDLEAGPNYSDRHGGEPDAEAWKQDLTPNSQVGDRSENVMMNTPYMTNPYQINQQAFQGYEPQQQAFGDWASPQDMSGGYNYNFGTPQAQNNWGTSYGQDYDYSYQQPNYYDYSAQSPDSYWDYSGGWGDPGQNTEWGGASDWSMPSADDYWGGSDWYSEAY